MRGGDEDLFVLQPCDHLDVLSHHRGHMTSHHRQVFAYHKLVVDLHLVVLVHDCVSREKMKKNKNVKIDNNNKLARNYEMCAHTDTQILQIKDINSLQNYNKINIKLYSRKN